MSEFRILVQTVTELAIQTDKGLLLAEHALEILRQRRIILPALTVIERVCGEAITRANRRIYKILNAPLSEHDSNNLIYGVGLHQHPASFQ